MLAIDQVGDFLAKILGDDPSLVGVFHRVVQQAGGGTGAVAPISARIAVTEPPGG